MKILYARSCQAAELDYLNASVNALGTDLRVPIIEAMLKCGHEVSIGTPMRGSDEIILREGRTLRQAAGVPDFDYSLFKNIKPFTHVKGYDLIFVEGSSTNTTFSSTPGTKISDAQVYYDLLDSFSGKVIYYQHGDQQTGMRFGAALKSTESQNPLNIANIFADIDGLAANKEWKILTHAVDLEAFLDRFNPGDLQYKNIGVPIHQIPMGYSENFDRALFHKKKNEPEYDIIYIGSQRKQSKNRERKLFKYLGNSGLKVKVIGKWDFKGMVEGIEFAGQTAGHGNVYDLYADALCTLQIGDGLFEQIGMPTTRIAQALRTGTILFVDGDINGVEGFQCLPQNIVYDQGGLVDKVRAYRNDSQQRLDCLNAQAKLCVKWEDMMPDILGGEFGAIQVDNMTGERKPHEPTCKPITLF